MALGVTSRVWSVSDLVALGGWSPPAVAEAPVQTLRQAIRDLHGCDADFVQAVAVVERMAAWEVGSMFGVHAARNFDVGPPDSHHVLLAESMYAISNALREAAGARYE